MKIFEITDKNLSWSALKGVDIDNVKSSYNSLIKALNIFIRLKSPSRSKMILNNVESFVSTVDKILNISFPDKNDEDIIKMKYELTEMREHILSLSKQLKL